MPGWASPGGDGLEFPCCSEDSTLPSGPVGDPTPDFGRRCVDERMGEDWGHGNLIPQRISDAPCDSGAYVDYIGDTTKMPYTVYGGWDKKYVFQVPISGTNDFETYQTPFLNQVTGLPPEWYFDIVASYKVTSNYVTLDAGTTPS